MDDRYLDNTIRNFLSNIVFYPRKPEVVSGKKGKAARHYKYLQKLMEKNPAMMNYLKLKNRYMLTFGENLGSFLKVKCAYCL